MGKPKKIVSTDTTNKVTTKTKGSLVVNQSDPNSIETFGEEYSNTLMSLSNSLSTSETKLKSLGEIGNTISNLMSTVKTLDPNMINHKPGFLERLFGNVKGGVGKFIENQKSVEDVVVNVSEKLRNDRQELIQENLVLENVYNDNISALNQMETLLNKGYSDLEILKSELEEYKTSVQNNLNDEEMLKIQTKTHFIERFEQKLSRLTNAKALVVRQLPQIRIMQTGNNTEIDTIKDVVDIAIPLWKSQIGLFISQLKTKTALDNRQSVTSTINETIRQNAELMNQNVTAIAAGSSGDIITVETIKTVNDNLISSITTMSEAAEKARQQRLQSFNEITKMDDDLKKLALK